MVKDFIVVGWFFGVYKNSFQDERKENQEMEVVV